MSPTLTHERRLWRDGHQWVAGLDEVGRGAWAGPVSVGVAVVSAGVRTRSMPRWLRDSKMLAEDRRESIFVEVADWCADGAVGHASAEECDRFGMTAALRLAALRALSFLEISPGALIVDGPRDLLKPPLTEVYQPTLDGLGAAEGAAGANGWCSGTGFTPRADPTTITWPEVGVPETVVAMVGADARCAAVAAASVLAKVVRDRLMREEAEHYPAYCFERNKGYPSPTHQMALRGYGLSSIHRRSWAFVEGLPWR